MTNPDPVQTCEHCQDRHVTTTGRAACQGHRETTHGLLPCTNRKRRGRPFCVDCDPLTVLPEVRGSGQVLARTRRRLAGTPLGPITGASIRDPLERLAGLAGQIDAWMGMLAARVAELTTIGNERGRPHAEIQAMHSSMRLLGDLLVAINRLDLDERLIRLDRIQADLMREVLDVMMRDPELDLSGQQMDQWPRAFARAARRRVIDVVDAEEVA